MRIAIHSSRYVLGSAAALLAASAWSASALGQPAVPPAPPAPPPAGAPAAPPPGAAPAQPPAAPAAPAPAADAEATRRLEQHLADLEARIAAGEKRAAEAEKKAEETTPKAKPAAVPAWLDKVKLEGFVDAYGSVNYGFPKPQSPTTIDLGNGPTTVGGNRLRAYDATNGFALHWAGVNATVAPEPVGGTISLRFGPSTTVYAGSDAIAGLQYVKQAFASWKPGGASGTVTVDFGKYDQPYGSEVADSQANINYTRSILYWYAQPLYFTGLRLDWAPSSVFDLKLFATNGWNASVDPNSGKTVGLQLNIKPNDHYLVAAGYMVGPEQQDWTTCPKDTAFAAAGCTPAAGRSGGLVDRGGANMSVRHLVDLVVDANPTDKLRLLFNADFMTEEVQPPTTTASYRMQVYGANLVGRYALGEVWAVALRGEYFRDVDGYATGAGRNVSVADGTLTIAATPTPNLILKLDNRADYSLDGDLFQRGAHDGSKMQITSTLGVVATTN